MKKVINARNIFYPFLAFLFGLSIARKLFGGQIDVIVITLLVILVVGVCLVMCKKVKYFVALLLLFLLGSGIYFSCERLWTPRTYISQVSIVGRIKEGVTEGEYNNYTVILDDVKIDGKSGKNIKLTIKNCEQTPKAGDIITFEGEIFPNKLFQLGKFNSSDVRENVKYKAEVNWGSIVTIDEGNLKLDERIRLRLRDIIFANMNERNGGIAYAVLFGDKTGVDGLIEEAYRDAGIIHVLTVSGLHVSFLIALLFGILKLFKVNKYVRFAIVTVFIAFYGYLCGFTPAVLRAGIMAVILMVAGLLGRKYDGLNSLGLAGFVICLTRPLMALDVGFLMSFFCVMTIYMLGPVLRRLFNKFLPHGISSLIAISISAQIGVLPFLATFGTELNLLAFAVNLIVVPIFSIIYPLLFVFSLLAAILPFLGKLLVIVNLLFSAINRIVMFFARTSLLLPVGISYYGFTLLVFLAIFGASQYFMIEDIKKFTILSLSSLVFATVLGCYSLPQKNGPRIAYINAGSDYSLVLTTSDGTNMIVGDNYLLSSYRIEYRTGKFDIFISSSGMLSGNEIDDLSAMGISKFITYSSQSESSKVTKVKTNTLFDIGTGDDKVSMAYLENDGEYLGLELIFCNKTIFLVNKSTFSYNSICEQYFRQKEPDIVFTDHEEDFTTSWATIISNTSDVSGNYNYQRNGDLLLTFKNEKMIVRGLD